MTRPYRGVSADDRRADRRERLLEALLEVVGESGVASVTIDAVCDRAGLTKRYFYESFADRDALLAASFDALLARLDANVAGRLSAVSGMGPGLVRAAVETLIDELTADPRAVRLYVEAPGHPALQERREAASRSFGDLVAAQAAYFPGDPPPGVDRSLVCRMLVAGTTELVTAWLSGSLEVDREQVIGTIVAVGEMATGNL